MNTSKKMCMIAAAVFAIGAASLSYAASGMKGMDHGAHGKSDDGHGKMKGMHGMEMTVKGEILDMSCFLSHGAMGSKHRKCAKACILDKGLPMGIRTQEGKVYFLLEDHAKGKEYKKVKELAAAQAEITGKLHSKDGVEGLAVLSVEKL